MAGQFLSIQISGFESKTLIYVVLILHGPDGNVTYRLQHLNHMLEVSAGVQIMEGWQIVAVHFLSRTSDLLESAVNVDSDGRGNNALSHVCLEFP